MAAALAVACANEAPPEGPPPPAQEQEAASIRAAREAFPTLFALQVGVVQTTCSPNPGVCHNSNNYPDLRTVGSLLAALEAPCNVEIPDPLQGWDRCERPADVLRAGDFTARVAWVERIGPGTWRVGLAAPPAATEARPMTITSADGHVVLNPPPDWKVQVSLRAGMTAADVTITPDQTFLVQFVDSVLATVVGGDPNRNGVFGAEAAGAERGRLVQPGSLERSYLWGRITGTVPGSRMPLANAPLDDAAYAAVACWIEGLREGVTPKATDPIDYDGCSYAKAPLDPAVE